MRKKYSILIVGLGSLGLNYIKAISKITLNMQVYCFDKNKIEKNQNFKNTKYINFSMILRILIKKWTLQL
jgi:predicted nucleotidyltransferase